MLRARRLLILSHRYLGIGVSLLVFAWFVTGITMIFAGGMPAVAAADRLERLPPIDFDRVRLTPSAAASTAGLSAPSRMTLLTILDRPAYRLESNESGASGPGKKGSEEPGGVGPQAVRKERDEGSVIVFADSGERLSVGAAESLAIAGRYLQLPPSDLEYLGLVRDPDQWTLTVRRQLPLHKVAVHDRNRTDLYVSPRTADVVMLTTTRTRALAWISAIPHWLYFTPLRSNNTLWRQAILWSSGLAFVTAAVGMLLAVVQWNTRYVGLMKWHYWTGVAFGVFALTWTFSGLLSIEPANWASSTSGTGQIQQAPEIPDALSGGPLEPSMYPPFDSRVWRSLPERTIAKEISFRRIQGDPYYEVRSTANEAMLLGARAFVVRSQPFSVDEIVRRVETAMSGAPLVSTDLIDRYDAYYYDRERALPLPVLRMIFDDPMKTWVYVDVTRSELVGRFARRQRVERWLYHGLHSLDFSFWYDNRLLWTTGVIGLCSGGALLSAIGVVIGFKRVRRVRRATR